MFTTALIAELLVLLMVGLTIGEHSHELSLGGVFVLLGQIAGFIVATWVLAGRVVPPLIELLERALRVPQLSFGLILGFLFVAVVVAEGFGLHGSLGALLLGVALSRLPHQVQRDIIPGLKSIADGFFVPLFFSSAGLHLTLSFIELPAWTIAALVTVPLIGKFAGAALGSVAARLDLPFTIASGLMAKGVAEIAILLVLLEREIIGPPVFSLFVLIMLAYILFAPPIITAAVSRAKPTGRTALKGPLPPSLVRFALDDITVGDVIDRERIFPDPEMSVRDFADQWIVPHQQGLRGRGQGRAGGDRIACDAQVSAQAGVVGHEPGQDRARVRAQHLARRGAGRRPPADDGEFPDRDTRQGPRVRGVRGSDHQPGNPGTPHRRSPRRALGHGGSNEGNAGEEWVKLVVGLAAAVVVAAAAAWVLWPGGHGMHPPAGGTGTRPEIPAASMAGMPARLYTIRNARCATGRKRSGLPRDRRWSTDTTNRAIIPTWRSCWR